MTIDGDDGRLTGALREAGEQIAAARGSVPVKEVASRVMERAGAGENRFSEILDAICLVTLEHGLAVEFTARNDRK